MRKLRVLVPAIVITAMLLLMIAPMTASAAPASAAPPQSGGWCSHWYTVHKGDTLGNIAWRYHTTALHLARLNHIPNPDLIYPGQAICVGGQHVPPPPPKKGFWYTVHRGDTLSRIAHRFDVSMWCVADANHIRNVDRIYAGQRLWIPNYCHW